MAEQGFKPVDCKVWHTKSYCWNKHILVGCKNIDIVEGFLRTDSGDTDKQFDQSMTRISVSQYSHLSNKLTRAKPLEYYVERTPDGITINLWPTPDDQETYIFAYYYMERIEDSGTPASNNMDIPARS